MKKFQKLKSLEMSPSRTSAAQVGLHLAGSPK